MPRSEWGTRHKLMEERGFTATLTNTRTTLNLVQSSTMLKPNENDSNQDRWCVVLSVGTGEGGIPLSPVLPQNLVNTVDTRVIVDYCRVIFMSHSLRRRLLRIACSGPVLASVSTPNINTSIRKALALNVRIIMGGLLILVVVLQGLHHEWEDHPMRTWLISKTLGKKS